jgi:hypothetical protein
MKIWKPVLACHLTRAPTQRAKGELRKLLIEGVRRIGCGVIGHQKRGIEQAVFRVAYGNFGAGCCDIDEENTDRGGGP